jgi:hypothetical protein
LAEPGSATTNAIEFCRCLNLVALISVDSPSASSALFISAD